MGKKVFVSHSHHDNDIVVTFVNDLLEVGLEVWVDLAGISSGNFMDRINAALSESAWFVLVVTPDSLASYPVRMEVSAALDMVLSKDLHAVIPFVGKRFDRMMMAPLWRPLHRFDAVDHGYTQAFRGLLTSLNRTAIAPLSVRRLGSDVLGIPPATPQEIQAFQAQHTLLRAVEVEMVTYTPTVTPPTSSPSSTESEILKQLGQLFERPSS